LHGCARRWRRRRLACSASAPSTPPATAVLLEGDRLMAIPSMRCDEEERKVTLCNAA